MDFANNAAFILFSAVSPLLIAFVKQSGFSRQVNALIALGCYVVVGIGGVIVSGEALNLENAVDLIAIATVVGSAAYGLVWNNIGANTEAQPSLDEQITEATSVVK
jgi:xanthine/uracil permease